MQELPTLSCFDNTSLAVSFRFVMVLGMEKVVSGIQSYVFSTLLLFKLFGGGSKLLLLEHFQVSLRLQLACVWLCHHLNGMETIW